MLKYYRYVETTKVAFYNNTVICETITRQRRRKYAFAAIEETLFFMLSALRILTGES
jgi:hypothetical protein